MTCTECRYYKETSETRGECRYGHPNPNWPVVMVDDWCGEFDNGSAEIEFCDEGDCH